VEIFRCIGWSFNSDEVYYFYALTGALTGRDERAGDRNNREWITKQALTKITFFLIYPKIFTRDK
jgi:hypothetical protein